MKKYERDFQSKNCGVPSMGGRERDKPEKTKSDNFMLSHKILHDFKEFIIASHNPHMNMKGRCESAHRELDSRSVDAPSPPPVWC